MGRVDSVKSPTWTWTNKVLIWDGVGVNKILEPKLERTSGEIGTLTFTVPKILLDPESGTQKVNSIYENFVENTSVVAIYQEGTLYWIGYVGDVTLNFDLSKSITVKDVLGFLKRDSVFIRPKTYYVTADKTNDTTKANLWSNANFVEITSARGSSSPLNPPVFNMGEVDVQRDVTKSFADNATDISVCWNAITNYWLDEYGGYFRPRYVESGSTITFYIDYTTDISNKTEQTVEYGVNMIDLEKTRHIPDDFVNYVYSSRENITTKGWWIFATSSSSIIYGNAADTDSIKKYGVYARRIVDDTATTDDALCAVCKKELAKYTHEIEETISVKAFDLYDTGAAKDRLGFMKKTHIISKPHGIDEWMVCTKEVLPLDKPDQKEFTFGRPAEKLTKQQAKNTASAQKADTTLRGLVRHAS